MVRWFVVFVSVAVIIIATCIVIASMLASNAITANIVTTVVTFITTLALVFQWHFPQTQAPQSLSRGWLWIAGVSLLVVIVVGIIGGRLVYLQQHPSDPFTQVTKGQSPIPTDFGNRWDHGDIWAPSGIGLGSCIPSPQTHSFNVVAKPQPGGFFSCNLNVNFTLGGDMALQVDIEMNAGEEAGITFKDNNINNGHNYYVYSIDSVTGSYQLEKDQNNQPTPPGGLTGTQSSAIHKGLNSSNTLALTMIGQRICLYANQSYLDCVRDPQPYATGTIGVYVGAYPGNATFSALKVWAL